MSELQIIVLGPPQILHAQKPLIFSKRKALALLLYLALEGGMHERATLSRLFWPDSRPEQQRTTLRTVLHEVRKVLNRENHEHLLVQRDLLGLDLNLVQLDVHVLQEALKNFRTHPSRITLIHLADILMTVRSPFLHGWTPGDLPTFEDWIATRRAYWHREINQAFSIASQALQEQGLFEETDKLIQRWIGYDPDQEVSQHHQAQLLTQRKRVTISTTLADGFPLEIPLVGRTSEHTELLSIYAKVVTHGTQMVLIQGEAGIGKTHQVKTLLDWARAQGIEGLYGQAYEMHGQLPYGPFLEALRARLERENAPDDLLSDIWLSELSRLFPELRDRYPDLPLPLAEGSEGAGRLFEAVAQLGLALTRRTPMILVIDDLHWADHATLDMLAYVARRWTDQQAHLLLVLTVRSETLNINPALEVYQIELARTLPLSQLELGPLNREAIQHLVQRLEPVSEQTSLLTSDNNARQQIGDWLFAETGGHPFYLVQILRALWERGILKTYISSKGNTILNSSTTAHALTTLSGILPVRVQDVIHLRLTRLSSATREVLTAASVLSTWATFDYLTQVSDLTETACLHALDEGLKSRLLREGRDVGGLVYIPAHDKIQAVVLMEAGEAKRRVFHRRALHLLQGTRCSASELAHHALLAQEWEDALRYSMQAGNEAMALFAVRDAILHYEQAQQLITEAVDDRIQLQQSPARWHLLLSLGHAYELIDDWNHAGTLYQTLIERAHLMHDLELECQALSRLATLGTHHAFELKPLNTFLEEKWQRVVPAPEQESPTWTVPTIEAEKGSWTASTAHEYARKALHLARQLHATELIARNLNTLALVYSMNGHFREEATAARQASHLYAQLKNSLMQIDSLNMLASASIDEGKVRRGLRIARMAFTLSQQSNNPWAKAQSAERLAYGLLQVGQYEHALRVVQDGIAIAQHSNLRPFLMGNFMVLGDIFSTIGRKEEAYDAYQQAQQAIDFPRQTQQILIRFCALYISVEAWDKALIYAQQVVAGRKHSSLAHWDYLRGSEIEALVHNKQQVVAEEEIRRFGECLGANQRYRIPFLRTRAVLAQFHKQPEQAILYLQEAAQIAQQLGLPGEVWRILAQLGMQYRLCGDDEQACTALANAAAIIHELADQMQDESLRNSFLESSQVRQTLEWWHARS